MGSWEFNKMHGAGNDFIMIVDMDGSFPESVGLVSSLCELHRGIGADGLILIRPSSTSDFRMLYFNRDGHEAEMCGNGARCAALLSFEQGVTGRSMVFETRSGMVKANVDDDGVQINIGNVDDLQLGMEIEGVAGELHYAVCGVPHALMLADDTASYSDADFVKIARTVRFNERFNPGGVNFNLASITGSNSLKYRTYERGVEAETLACGTGAVAVAVMCEHLGLVESPVECSTGGGDSLLVEFTAMEEGGLDCRLKGPAEISFTGTFDIDRYILP